MVTSRIFLTSAQKAELWERWKQGQSISSISRALDRRNKTGVQRDGLLRQYFPRETNLSYVSQDQLNAVALRLNQRPRWRFGRGFADSSHSQGLEMNGGNSDLQLRVTPLSSDCENLSQTFSASAPVVRRDSRSRWA